MAEEFTQTVKTDDGYHLLRYRKVGEVGVTRRDDLRGCWEVTGTVFGSREEAFAAAEHYLSTTEDADDDTMTETTAPVVGQV